MDLRELSIKLFVWLHYSLNFIGMMSVALVFYEPSVIKNLVIFESTEGMECKPRVVDYADDISSNLENLRKNAPILDREVNKELKRGRK